MKALNLSRSLSVSAAMAGSLGDVRKLFLFTTTQNYFGLRPELWDQPGGEQLLGRREPDATSGAAVRSWAGLFQHGKAIARPPLSLVPRSGLGSLPSGPRSSC